MYTLTVIIFLLTYAGIAIGEIPGLALDRTGIAILGAIAMVASGVMSTEEAIMAIHFPTILLLYSLMVISSQFRLGGFYTWIALKIAGLTDRPWRFLFIMMLASAGLSSLLTNDIICFAFTPVITVSAIKAGLNPVPYLIGLALSANIGSAVTIIGNPQNMLIGQLGRLPFGEFILWCLPPSVFSLMGAYLILKVLYSKKIFIQPPNILQPAYQSEAFPPFNRHQSTKGIIALLLLIVMFFTPVSREVSAIVIAGLLLCSRTMRTRSILANIDWHLLTLFAALFIVIQAIEIIHLPERILSFLEDRGMSLHNLYNLTIISTVVSNLVSNVPATMLLTRFLEQGVYEQWYVLAISSTYAGNLIVIGSIANLIVFETASNYGVKITFTEHARAGVPVTLLSLLITGLWIFFNS
ncbi:MAG: anion transporter [Thermodesulfovibrionales bacterium]|nr:anion transporter [Thermodesulfovibrionales bacterium]